MTETVGWLGTWLRLLWRHWPVLLTLAAGAVLIRSLLINHVLVDAARWREGLGGELAFALLPIVMLVSMILMLRAVRPSLPYLGPREPPEPALRHLASVAIPFVAFYFTAGYLVRDFQFFGFAVAQTAATEAAEQALGELVGVQSTAALPDILDPDRPEVYLAIAAGAFLVRWVLSLLGSARRTIPGLLAVYPEVMWVTTTAVAANVYLGSGRDWFERTRAYQLLTSNVDGWDLAWLTTLFPSFETAAAVIVIPVTALVAGTTVLVASARPRPDAPTTGLRRFLPSRDKGSGGPFGVLADALRRVFRAGVGATMVFCLAFAVVSAAPGYLGELERVLIGRRDYSTIWAYLEFPLIYLNESVTLVLMFSLIAAFVDRTARRQAGRSSRDSVPAPRSGAAEFDLGDTQRLPAVPSTPSPYAPVPAGQGVYGAHAQGAYGAHGQGPPAYGQASTGIRT
jgi:hypothetical protein